ncbi:MAG: ArsR family transcriptional regulator [Thermodesulfobacterium geofontis]|uniref:ArsR family transcriptional regulator n=1 Tax=Thermodesulfobacterium geofontis TaxID=1295609 RepID=A0A2N7PPS6_9BACT|nr:MAG: ArsR family transcriptional regulator [Thermodesulfobacterium geofontis]
MDLKDLTKIFKALSDETRLKILKILEKGETCVCEMVALLNINQPGVSFHISVLKEAGLIKSRKEGNRIFYSLDESDLFKRFLILSVLEKLKIAEEENLNKYMEISKKI